MIRKLPNLSFVLPAASKAKPWKVVRHSQRREHVAFSRRVMQSRQTFIVTLVGRYRHQWQADNAALVSAQRCGGFAVNAHGGQWPPGRQVLAWDQSEKALRLRAEHAAIKAARAEQEAGQ